MPSSLPRERKGILGRRRNGGSLSLEREREETVVLVGEGQDQLWEEVNELLVVRAVE
jgi:hypothetical protein